MQRLGPAANIPLGKDVAVQSRDSLQLSSLFTTMMESNAILREEIAQMEGKEPNPPGSSLDDAADSDADRIHWGKTDSRQLHSQSLPARLLENSSKQPPVTLTTTWIPSSPSQLTKRDSVHTVSGSESNDSGTESTTDATEGQGTDEEVNNSDLNTSPLHHRVLAPPHRHVSGPLLTRLPLSITSISSTELSESDSETSPEPENDPFASPGESTIETMWDNFSVEEYAPPLKHKLDPKAGISKPVAKTALSRRVTIPEPFVMTIRDEARPKRRKSRALIAAEREKLEREMQEELECLKKFRALPVPATTYVPVDEMKRQGRDQEGQLGCEKVVEPIKPFRFMKREEEKCLRNQQRQRDEMTDTRETLQFRAKPVPQSILSPRVSEELKEREEYRRILIKVRSHEMLARAQLPKNMQEKQKRDSLKKQRLEEMQNRALVTEEHTFRPKIRRQVPDHDQLYCHFQEQLAARKEVKPATTPKPFLLRTASTPSRCLHPQDEEHQHSIILNSFFHHTTAKSRTCDPKFEPGSRAHSKHCTREPAVAMTQTAKLRRSASERKLAECAEREAEGEEVRKMKREEQRELQSRVIHRVQSDDRSAWLEERQRERLQELREQDQARRTAYKKELQAMKQRVAARPLVFEQVSRDAARRAAEIKYREALKKAGLSEDEIKFLDKQIAQ
ncbi:Protein FAM161B [Geodia barretti]|uniref:Protein FAM161B n=1 Tax=Geodia barretti TaxID=519541 RepID=A0AA35X5Z0_GEOBA|nr:Protein FAM161B [Geodia barretti]